MNRDIENISSELSYIRIFFKNKLSEALCDRDSAPASIFYSSTSAFTKRRLHALRHYTQLAA